MKSKNNNSTVGRGTPGSRGHGLTESDDQKKDKARLKALNGRIKGTKFVRVRVPVEEVNLDQDSKTELIPEDKDLASFPSNFAALRRDEHDNLGYRIPRLVPGPNGEDVRMPEQRGRKKGTKLKEGAKVGNRKIPAAYSAVVPGQPDIDAGVDGWIQPTDTRDFVRRGNRMDSLLETFNRVTFKKVHEEDEHGKFVLNSKGKRNLLKLTPYVKPFRAESSKLEVKKNAEGEKVVERVKTDAMTLTYRNTIGVSPGLSRALQRLLEDGHFLEARKAIEATVEPFGRFYEATYRGPETHAKVTSLVPHLDSGHFHYDTWNHTTYLDTAPTGVDQKIVPVRRWDAKASCHYGPGPGVTFWMRHFVALGDLDKLAEDEPEVAKRVGYTKMLCEQAIAGCRQRAESSFTEASEEKKAVEEAGGTYTAWIRPADDYARDIRVSQEADRLLAKAIGDLGLEKDYVGLGMAEYREHLIEAYKTGNTGIRMDTVEDLAEVVKVVERAELRARGVSEANKKVLLAAKLEKEDAELLMLKAAELLAEVEADKLGLKAALAAAVDAQRVAEAARDAAVEDARKEAAPILKEARLIELHARTLMDELPTKEAGAELRGVKAAFKALLPKERPVAETAEGIIAEIETGIREAALAEVAVKEAGAELRGVKAAFKAILPKQKPAADTAEEIIAEIETGIREAALAEVAVKEAGAELRGVKAAFNALLPKQKPVAKTAKEIIAEIGTGIQRVRDAVLAEVAVREADLEAREQKIGELETKAGLWDRVAPLLERVFKTLTGRTKELVQTALATDTGKPDADIGGWAALLARISTIVISAKDKVLKTGKDQGRGV